jgi:hypothetical protein
VTRLVKVAINDRTVCILQLPEHADLDRIVIRPIPNSDESFDVRATWVELSAEDHEARSYEAEHRPAVKP